MTRTKRFFPSFSADRPSRQKNGRSFISHNLVLEIYKFVFDKQSSNYPCHEGSDFFFFLMNYFSSNIFYFLALNRQMLLKLWTDIMAICFINIYVSHGHLLCKLSAIFLSQLWSWRSWWFLMGRLPGVASECQLIVYVITRNMVHSHVCNNSFGGWCCFIKCDTYFTWIISFE